MNAVMTDGKLEIPVFWKNIFYDPVVTCSYWWTAVSVAYANNTLNVLCLDSVVLPNKAKKNSRASNAIRLFISRKRR